MAVLELQSPFNELWRKGYLVVNKEPRRNVVLYNSQSDRTTISYAKYLMSVHLGRILSSEEIVDHINGDKLDDRLENYQIISARDNLAKYVVQSGNGEWYVKFRCGVCDSLFERERRKTHLVVKSRRSTFCTKKCTGGSSGKFSEVVEEYRKNPQLDKDTKH